MEVFSYVLLTLLFICEVFSLSHHIRHLHVIFRHGDRSPLSTFPNDGHPANLTWPEGMGQLTQLGIEQQFLLGKWFREKYESFIPHEYNASIVHVQSTDVDRTLMSASSFSAGLFKRSKSSLEKYGLHWRPIPIHTVPEEFDILFGKEYCPRVDQLIIEARESSETKAFLDTHKSLFNLLRRETGLPNVTVSDIWRVHDDLFCIASHNLSFPSWFTPGVQRELDQVVNYIFWLRYWNDEVVRLQVGIFMKILADHLRWVVNSSARSDQRFSHILSALRPSALAMIYSAHDFNVAAVLSALGVLPVNDSKPAYTALVVFELVGPEPPMDISLYHVRVLYKRGIIDPSGEYLQPLACSKWPTESGCPLSVFLGLLDHFALSPEQLKKACEVETVEPRTYWPLFIVIIIAIAILLLVVCFVLTGFVLRYIRRATLFTTLFDEPEAYDQFI